MDVVFPIVVVLALAAADGRVLAQAKSAKPKAPEQPVQPAKPASPAERVEIQKLILEIEKLSTSCGPIQPLVPEAKPLLQSKVNAKMPVAGWPVAGWQKTQTEGRLAQLGVPHKYLEPATIEKILAGRRTRCLTADVPGFASAKGRFRLIPTELGTDELGIDIIDRRAGTRRRLIALAGPRCEVAFAHDGTTVILRDAVRTVRTFDLELCQMLQCYAQWTTTLGVGQQQVIRVPNLVLPPVMLPPVVLPRADKQIHIEPLKLEVRTIPPKR